MMQRIELSDGWTVQAYAGAGLDRGVGSMPATVPGAVHADLIAAGLIADPLLDRNEALTGWVGHTNWRYEKRLAPEDSLEDWVEPGTRLDLVFEGIDTAATIALDDRELLTTENMHRSYRIDLAAALPSAANRELSVSIESPWTAAERHRDRLGPLPNTYDTPYNFLRTMACSFGWDWGPTVPGAALWRPVFLERWSVARLAQVRPLVRVWPDGLGAVTVGLEIEWSQPRSRTSALEVVLHLNGRDGREFIARSTLEPDQERLEVTLLAEDVELWWPHTLGEPVLYGLTVTLGEPDGALLDTWERRIGFRTIELDTTPDDPGHDDLGTAFTLVVNGLPVFAKGVNWIPDDPFPARITPDRYADQVAEAVLLGADLIRVWGGGIYESEAFYEACDRLGVMVWQDFAFACAAYPEEEPFATEVAAEATEAVTRLMPHPSLVLWCGNNENLWGHVDWAWAEQTEGRTWGRGFYLEVLPEIVGRIDPTRPYWPGSPWSQQDTTATANEIHPNDPEHGCSHEWEVWNRVDLDHYRDLVPRFLSEFGWQAAPTWSTLREALTDQHLSADSPGVRAHQKAEDGDLKLARGLAKHTFTQASGVHGPAGGPDQGADWVYRTQVVQARAAMTGVEHLRSHRGRCMGTIWWQLNDCWPAVSWSVIDKARRRKLAWFALRRSYRPRLLTVQPRAAGLAAILVNDTANPWKTSLVAERLTVSGRFEVLAAETRHVEVPAYDVFELPLAESLATPTDPTGEVLRVHTVDAEAQIDTTRSETAWWWFVSAAELKLPHPAGEVTIEPTTDGLHIEVRARTCIRDLCLLPDHLHPDATVDDNLFTLADGEVADFTVRLPDKADRQVARDAVLAGNALRCLGDGPRAFRIVTPFLAATRTGAR